MKRPATQSKLPDKPRYLRVGTPQGILDAAAEKASYTSDGYHCPRPNGRPPPKRSKPATLCPRDWSIQQGLNIVRNAIRAGHVSRAWVDGFPRHIWHKEGDTWYEGHTTPGNAGVYHGYPIEVSGLPPGLAKVK